MRSRSKRQHQRACELLDELLSRESASAAGDLMPARSARLVGVSGAGGAGGAGGPGGAGVLGANLSNVGLSGAELPGAELPAEADLSAAELPAAELPATNLSNTICAEPLLPMLAKPLREWAALPSDLTEWRVEEKLDGLRLLAVVSPPEPPIFYTRTLKPYALPEWRLGVFARTDCVLDGELVFVDNETNAIVPICDTGRGRKSLRHEYRVFDLQRCNGRTVTHLDLLERRELLLGVLIPNVCVKIVEQERLSDSGQLKVKFEECLRLNGEGLILKRCEEAYLSNRRAWLKLKPLHLKSHRLEVDLFAHRFLPDKNGRLGILECGYYEGDHFRQVCRVSSGICAAKRARLQSFLRHTGRFVRPVVVTIVADRFTRHRRSLRHPSLARVREDLERIDINALFA